MILAIIVVAFVFFIAHKYSHKKLLIIIFCIMSLIFVWFQFRHFYTVNDITFSVWKTKNGCYITPYRYLGFSLPKKNYINISNIGSLTIFVENKSTLLIFHDRTDDGLKNINCNLKNFDYQEFLPTGYKRGNNGIVLYEKVENYFEMDSILKEKRKQCIDLLPFISIDARTMSIEIRNTE